MTRKIIQFTTEASTSLYIRGLLTLLLGVGMVCGLCCQSSPAQGPVTSAQPYGYVPLSVNKIPSWSGWEIHGSVSAPIVDYSYWSLGRSYERTTNRNALQRFVRPDGTFVYGIDFGRESPDKPVVSTQLYQLGVNRQMSWGGLWRFSVGYYRSIFRMRNDDFTDLKVDEIRTFLNDSERAILTEAGFHYVFLRRRRFRPYLGAHLTVFPYYDGVSTTSFIEGDSRQVGLVERFFSTEYFPPYLDFSLTLGFQYQISERLTAGAFLWANGAADLYLDAPLGVEVRYSLKKRPRYRAKYKPVHWY